jgi:hypothetical protein
MSLQPEDRKILMDIYREVGETKVAVNDLASTVSAHVLEDDRIHETLHGRITALQTDQKASTLKHRIAISLGLTGVAGAGTANESVWQAIAKIFYG